MKKLNNLISEKDASLLKQKEQPAWINPMLATLTDDRFSDPDWIFERKLDGERCLVFKNGDSVSLMSRNKKKLNDKYPEIVDLIQQQEVNFIADGEIVAFEGNVTSFSKLQQRMHKKKKNEKPGIEVFYYLFDILYADQYDTTQLPQRSRKKLLQNYINFSNNKLRYTEHQTEKGKEFIEIEIGGHAQGNIGHAIDFKEKGFDGLIHLKPFGCLPELVSQTVIDDLSEKYEIPVLTISIDEQTADANVLTRVEAFLDMIKEKDCREVI